MFRNPALYFDQTFPGFTVLCKCAVQFFLNFCFFSVKGIFLFLSCIDLNTDRIGAVSIVLVIHPYRIDLLFQDIDLPFKLLFQQIRLIELIFCSFDGKVDFLDFLLDSFIFCLHLIISLI